MRNESLALIMESTNYVPYEQILDMELYEGALPSSPGKVKIKAVLQESDVRNQNGRVYDNNICNKIIEALKPKVQNRSLFQEIDHPMVISKDDDGMLSKKRAIIVELKNCGSILSEIYRDGPKIIGIIETLSGFMGPELYRLIVEDRAGIGFSLRSFGRVVTEESMGQTIHRVTTPIRPITYDIVTNPSHANARVLEVVNESLNTFLVEESDESLLEESTFELDNLTVPKSNLEVLQFREELFKEQFRNSGIVKFNL